MSRILFVSNFLENGIYTCHARVGFASAREQRDFLQRNNAPPDANGWRIAIASKPLRGYDGKPVYQADIRLSTCVSPRQPDWAVHESGPQADGSAGSYDIQPDRTRRDALTWAQQAALQRDIAALLRQLGMTDLGWRR